MSFRRRERELSPAELSCPVTGCILGKDHNGPCVDRFGGEGAIEIRERNLMLLMEDDSEGFRKRIRELLKEKEQSQSRGITPLSKETIRRADISGRLDRDGRCV